jgi:hypothetical protein
MSWTKRQFVEQAFEEVGYASYTFDLTPEQLESAMRRLDAMMATWNGKGIRLGYPIPTSPENSSLDQATEVPDSANEAIYTNLAVRLAPSIGKVASVELKATAREGYRVLLNRATATPPTQQLPGTMPSGAGNKPWRNDNPFLDAPDDPIETGGDGPLDFT